ncbi:MAG: diguanylate cyclase [Eubacterium sp.]|nr:diguanylate cyclase [Eubacterium sp.]
MYKKRSHGLSFWFTIIFVSFTVIVLAVSGLATYFSQMSNYKEECEQNIRNIGEYLAALMKNDGPDFAKYQEYFMNHYKEMKIGFDFDSFEEARVNFIKEFSERYPGKALGIDVQIEDTPDEVQKAYFTYKHEFWLLTFEKAREIFDIPYSYYLVMGDDRARIDSLEDGDDPKYNVCYMIDGERTLDENKGENNEKYLYLGDTYYNARDVYKQEWNTWETGKKQNGYQEWDNDWGHTYSYYTPLIIDGKKLGLIGTEINVETVNRDIIWNTFKEIGIIAVILIGGMILVLAFIRVRFIRRLYRLEDAMATYSQEKDVAIADEFEKEFTGNDEIDSLGKVFVSMIREVGEHMQKMIRASRQLEVSRKREHEMSELAIKDSLTGIRNKTAYDREVFKIEREIENGDKSFGVAMIDLNFLKKINDTYGHEKGDIAIQTLCRLVCVTFAHSPVFRIGGDEFVVILKNSDYAAVDSLVEKFNAEIKAMSYDGTAEMWEAPSAAIGYALYEERLDAGSYESVFKRADDKMYQRKQEMKAVRKDD